MCIIFTLQYIVSVVSSSHQQITNLTATEWALATDLFKMLSYFAQATKTISCKDTSLGEVWSLVESLKALLKSRLAELNENQTPGTGLKGLVNDLLSELNRRFQKIVNDETYILATGLDPRFKTSLFDAGTSQMFRNLVIQKLKLSTFSDSKIDVTVCEDDTDTSDDGNDHKSSLAKVCMIS